MTVTPYTTVAPIPRQPLPYGLFSTLNFRPQQDRWEGGGILFETLTCEHVQGIGPWNCDSTSTTGLPLDLTHATAAVGEFAQALPFTLYGHFHCGPVGWTPEQAQAKAEEHLTTGEQRAAENAFWTGSLSSSPTLQSASTTDITVLDTTFTETLGLLENWIGTTYGSLGVIHMTRAAALSGLTLGALTTSNGSLTTKLGTPVAAGSGYPGTGPLGQVPTARTTWMYATPALTGYRSDIFYSSNRAGDLFTRGTNDLIAVAERSYLIGHDPCGVAAALTAIDAMSLETLEDSIDGGTP